VELADGGWQLYVAGTDQFDANDDTGDWAAGPYCWNDPAGHQNDPSTYHPIPEIATLPPSDAVDYVAQLVRDLAPWQEIPVDGVAAGFDEGDFAIIYTHQDDPPAAAV
jgi:hypothetical protein